MPNQLHPYDDEPEGDEMDTQDLAQAKEVGGCHFLVTATGTGGRLEHLVRERMG